MEKNQRFAPVDRCSPKVKGSLSRSKNENKLDNDLYCKLEREVLIRLIQRNQGHRDSMMHEFSSSVIKVNKAVAKVRTIGDRLPLTLSNRLPYYHYCCSLFCCLAPSRLNEKCSGHKLFFNVSEDQIVADWINQSAEGNFSGNA